MENSKISWTDHTFNPWSGCTKVSAGCQHCYAEQLMDKRFGEVQWGPAGTRKRTSSANWKKPLQWSKQMWSECSFCGTRGDYLSCPRCDSLDMRPARQRVFCASLADVFEDRPELVEWRRDLFDMVLATPHLDWLILTKRPENIVQMASLHNFSQGLPNNIWLGTSVENQETANERIPHLLKVPAAVRFLSMEPLLGPVHLGEMYDHTTVNPGSVVLPFYHGIGWVIVGGESGPNARPMHPEWVRSIRDQCVAAGVPFHFKQWGEWVSGDYPAHGTHWQYAKKDKFAMKRVGKKSAGRLLDGREWNEYPKVQR